MWVGHWLSGDVDDHDVNDGHDALVTMMIIMIIMIKCDNKKVKWENI